MKEKPEKVYIDYNATTPLRAEVKAAMIEDMEIFGNASSMHASGRLARARVEQARLSVGKLIGAKNGTIIFTSGGSEANNTVFQTMRHLVESKKDETTHNSRLSIRDEIITTAIEHPCVLNSALNLKKSGFKVTILPVDEYGKLRIDELEKTLNDKTLFVSVMAANNEIGTVQDIKTITSLVKKAGAFFHVDAVQAAGKIPLNADETPIDYLTVSAHKIYGPKGVGALYVKKGAPLFPIIFGGHQEDGLRAGTYNNIGILGWHTRFWKSRRNCSLRNGKIRRGNFSFAR